jgi:hypothetical protein
MMEILRDQKDNDICYYCIRDQIWAMYLRGFMLVGPSPLNRDQRS